MNRILERSEVFVILTAIVLVNVVFVWAAAEGYFRGGVYNYGRFLLLGGTLAVVVFAIRGWVGIKEIIAPLFKWRVHPKWYAFAILWPLGIASTVLAIKVLFTETRFEDLDFQTQFLTRFDILFTVGFGALIGEIVWVSYSIRRLSRFTSFFLASIIVAIFWTLWWMPMAYFNFGIIPGLTPFSLLINQTGVALICGLLYFHSRSALCVLILQFCVNLSLLVFPVLPTNGGSGTYIFFATTYLTLAVLAYLLLGPKPLFRKQDA